MFRRASVCAILAALLLTVAGRCAWAEVKGSLSIQNIFFSDGGRKIAGVEGTGVVKNDEGEILGKGELGSSGGFMTIPGKQGTSFVHKPGEELVAKDKWPTTPPKQFATVELTKPYRWTLKDGHFLFLAEAPTLTSLRMAVDESLARASILKLPEGTFQFWGYQVTVGQGGGYVKFQFGRIVDGSNVTGKGPEGKTLNFPAQQRQVGKEVVVRVVTSRSTPLKDGETVLLTIDQGTELVVSQVKESWIAVAMERGGQKTVGWVYAEDVDLAPDRAGEADAGTDTPLHKVALSGPAIAAEVLLAKRADVNVKNKFGETPLHLAAWGGNVPVAMLLLARGADVHAKAYDSTMILQETVFVGGGTQTYVAAVRGEKIKGDVAITPLHWAAARGHRDMAELLLKKGADANAKDSKGQTPLDWAKGLKHQEVAELLREHAANQ